MYRFLAALLVIVCVGFLVVVMHASNTGWQRFAEENDCRVVETFRAVSVPNTGVYVDTATGEMP